MNLILSVLLSSGLVINTYNIEALKLHDEHIFKQDYNYTR